MITTIRRRPLLRAAAIGAGVYYVAKLRQDATQRRRLAELTERYQRGMLTATELEAERAALIGS